MGREIRMVPLDWDHPKYTDSNAPYSNRVGEYRPLYDEDYDSASKRWLKGLNQWQKGKHPSQTRKNEPSDEQYFWEYEGNPPDRDSYRDRAWTKAEATAYQVYETVSEGTPVTPAFATKEELIEYLVANGDFWDQKRGKGGWPRTAAESFVKDEYAPSLISVIEPGKTPVILEPRDGRPESK